MSTTITVRLTPDGTLTLPPEIKEKLPDTDRFALSWQGDVLLLLPISLDVPVEEKADRALEVARRYLQQFREAIKSVGGCDSTPEELLAALRAIREQVWKEEYRDRYTDAFAAAENSVG